MRMRFFNRCIGAQAGVDTSVMQGGKGRAAIVAGDLYRQIERPGFQMITVIKRAYFRSKCGARGGAIIRLKCRNVPSFSQNFVGRAEHDDTQL